MAQLSMNDWVIVEKIGRSVVEQTRLDGVAEDLGVAPRSLQRFVQRNKAKLICWQQTVRDIVQTSVAQVDFSEDDCEQCQGQQAGVSPVRGVLCSSREQHFGKRADRDGAGVGVPPESLRRVRAGAATCRACARRGPQRPPRLCTAKGQKHPAPDRGGLPPVRDPREAEERAGPRGRPCHGPRAADSGVGRGHPLDSTGGRA